MTAREPMRLSSVEFDLVTKSEANERFASKGGMFAKAHRVASQRKAVKEALGKLGAAPSPFFTPVGAAPSFTLPNRIEITSTRIGPGMLDAHDNLRAALKAVVDAVCEDWIGLRDDDPRIKVMPARQEKTPGVSTQGPCGACGARGGNGCFATSTNEPRVKGLHAARRTPWRVRIEVRDLTPGPDRVLVLASTEPQKRKKAKGRPPKQNAPEGSEDHSARMLVGCDTHGVAVGVSCGPRFDRLGGVCARRAVRAGIVVAKGGERERAEPRPTALDLRDAYLAVVRGAPGADELVRSMLPKPPGPRRIVGPPVVRVALPWRQPTCGACGGIDTIGGDALTAREREAIRSRCFRCKGRGIVGPLALSIDPKVDARAASVTYRVPAAHVAWWGSQVTLSPRRYRVAALGVVTVFELKGPRR